MHQLKDPVAHLYVPQQPIFHQTMQYPLSEQSTSVNEDKNSYDPGTQ